MPLPNTVDWLSRLRMMSQVGSFGDRLNPQRRLSHLLSCALGVVRSRLGSELPFGKLSDRIRSDSGDGHPWDNLLFSNAVVCVYRGFGSGPLSDPDENRGILNLPVFGPLVHVHGQITTADELVYYAKDGRLVQVQLPKDSRGEPKAVLIRLGDDHEFADWYADEGREGDAVMVENFIARLAGFLEGYAEDIRKSIAAREQRLERIRGTTDDLALLLAALVVGEREAAAYRAGECAGG